MYTQSDIREVVCCAPFIRSRRPKDLILVEIGVIDRIDVTFLLNDDASMVIVSLRGTSLRLLAGNGNRCRHSIASIDLQSGLIGRDVESYTRIRAPDREFGILALRLVVDPAIVKPDTSCSAEFTSSSLLDCITQTFGIAEVGRGALDIGKVAGWDQNAVRGDDLRRFELREVVIEVLRFLICFQVPVNMRGEHDRRLFGGERVHFQIPLRAAHQGISYLIQDSPWEPLEPIGINMGKSDRIL